MTHYMAKNTCIFCGHIDERHDRMDYCSQCGKLGHALYRKFFDTAEGRAALVKAVPGLTGQQLSLSSYWTGLLMFNAVISPCGPGRGE